MRLMRGHSHEGGITIGLPRDKDNIIDWAADQLAYSDRERSFADIMKDCTSKLEKSYGDLLGRKKAPPPPPPKKAATAEDDAWAGARGDGGGGGGGWGASTGWGGPAAGDPWAMPAEDNWGAPAPVEDNWGAPAANDNMSWKPTNANMSDVTASPSIDAAPTKAPEALLKPLSGEQRSLLETAVDFDLVAQLSSMQFHPALLPYRRFVMVLAESEKRPHGESVSTFVAQGVDLITKLVLSFRSSSQLSAAFRSSPILRFGQSRVPRQRFELYKSCLYCQYP